MTELRRARAYRGRVEHLVEWDGTYATHTLCGKTAVEMYRYPALTRVNSNVRTFTPPCETCRRIHKAPKVSADGSAPCTVCGYGETNLIHRQHQYMP